MRCPCCDAVDVDARHARICPRAWAQMNQRQPLLHAISRILKRLGIPHQVESEEPFTADRNLRMDIIVRRGCTLDPSYREYDKSILVTYVDSKSSGTLRGGGADHNGSAASTSGVLKRQPYERPWHTSFDERSHKLATFEAARF